jgi:hypothetical protein
MNTCECGCGSFVKQRFISGHNRRGCGTNNHLGKVFHTKVIRFWENEITKSKVEECLCVPLVSILMGDA